MNINKDNNTNDPQNYLIPGHVKRFSQFTDKRGDDYSTPVRNTVINFEEYENILNKNMNSLSDADLEEFEKKLEM